MIWRSEMVTVEERRAESHDRRLTTKDARKQKALAGTRVLYLTCPLCGLNRPLSSYKGSATFQVKPDYAIIQVRYGGGRGSGFFLAEEESISLSDLKATNPEVELNLKTEVLALVKALVDVGYIGRADLREVLNGSKAE